MANNNIWLLVVIGALAVFVIFGNPFAPKDETPATPTTPGSVDGCNVEDVTFTPKMVRLGKAGTTITGAHGYYVTTDNIGFALGGSTKTLPTNYEAQVLFGENSTTYYTLVKNINTGCSDPKYETVSLALADTSLTGFKAENEDGSINSVSNAQVVGADEVIEFEICYKAGADQYFGNPNSACQNIGVLEYDKTYIRSAEGSLGTASVPSFFTATNASNDGQNAFIVPKVGSNEKLCFSVQLESTTSNIAAANAQPILHIYDCDIDKNEDDLTLVEGVEDEDYHAISLAPQTLTVYLS